MKLVYKISVIFFTLCVLLFIYYKVDKDIVNYINNSGITDKEIIIGQTIDLSGKVVGSKSFHLGFTTAIDRYNRNGGINGRNIVYHVLDDGNNPQKALENCKLLINFYNCFCIFGSYGETCTNAIIPYITEMGVPLIAPSSGSLAVREPFNKMVVNCQASYYDEISKILNFMSVKKLYNFSIIYDRTNNLINIVEKLLILNQQMTNFNLLSHAIIEDTNDLYTPFSNIINNENPFNKKSQKPGLESLDFIIISSSENNITKLLNI